MPSTLDTRRGLMPHIDEACRVHTHDVVQHTPATQRGPALPSRHPQIYRQTRTFLERTGSLGGGLKDPSSRVCVSPEVCRGPVRDWRIRIVGGGCIGRLAVHCWDSHLHCSPMAFVRWVGHGIGRSCARRVLVHAGVRWFDGWQGCTVLTEWLGLRFLPVTTHVGGHASVVSALRSTCPFRNFPHTKD
jgi:hypothetical protein